MPRSERFRREGNLGGKKGRHCPVICTFLGIASLLAVCAVPAAAASDISLHREHNGWIATIRGSLYASQGERISLLAVGDITVRGVRGGHSNRIVYTLTQLIGEAGETEARQAAVQLETALQRQAGATSVTFPCTSRTLRIEIPRDTSLVTITSVAGDIDVAEIDGSVITRNGAGRTSLDRIGGNASIHTTGGATRLGLIGGALHCVSGGGSIQARTIRGDSVFETGGGEIYAAEALGTVHAYTGGGGIRIGHAGSSVTATTQGGPIEVGRAAGPVIARNSGGPIRVSSAPGVRCETASGAVRLTGVSGNVVASTTLGNVFASFSDAKPLAKSFLSTHEGDITVLIPSNISVTLRVTSHGGVGRIKSDFPLRLVSRGPVMTAEGNINGSGPLLQIVGRGGMIFIKRQ